MNISAAEPHYFITFGMIGLFLAVMIAVLYATNRKSTSFTDYAVGGDLMVPGISR